MNEKKVFKTARLDVEGLHIAIHKLTDRKKPDHRAGYYDGAFAYFAVILRDITARLDRMEKSMPKKKQRRTPTPWQKHVSDALKDGKTIQFAARTWWDAKG